MMKSFYSLFARNKREHHTNSNLENRIDEDEKLRNLSLENLLIQKAMMDNKKSRASYRLIDKRWT